MNQMAGFHLASHHRDVPSYEYTVGNLAKSTEITLTKTLNEGIVETGKPLS